MAKKIEWHEHYITAEPAVNHRKVTGTRMAAILGLDPWKTSFQMWCEINKVYRPEFTGNKYTEAGKVIEPKIIDMLRKLYFTEETVIYADDVYGKDAYKHTGGDFFPENEIFGGMWDGYLVDVELSDPTIEIKTTSRSPDWIAPDGTVQSPQHQALQCALYSYLRGSDHCIMAVAFLEEKDYENPENFVPDASNTHVEVFKIEDRFPNFDSMLASVFKWFDKYIYTGKSPFFDEKKDKEYLEWLRTNHVDVTDQNVKEIIAQMEQLLPEVELKTSELKSVKDEYDSLEAGLKEYMKERFRDGDTKVALDGVTYTFSMTKSQRKTADTKRLELDGLSKYIKISNSYRLNKKVLGG